MNGNVADDDRTMLVLSGLAYRGFQDVLPGEPHEHAVRRAILAGLDPATGLSPVKGKWDLVWGPVTSRIPLGVFDSSAMYVVRSKAEAGRYVVVVRGTNPVASTDWLFGDFLVGAAVPWPFSDDGSVVSASTALGLMTLQRMRSESDSPIASFADSVREHLGAGLDELTRAGRAWVGGLTHSDSADPVAMLAQTERIAAHWLSSMQQRADVLDGLSNAEGLVRIDPSDLRRPLQADGDRGAGVELLTFLRSVAPLEVMVTGHSKGGALAPTLALWLAETKAPGTPQSERWDPDGRASIGCVAFAGPTPGNAAFAARIDDLLGERLRQVANERDLVTKAWAVADLATIPGLYGLRSAPLEPLVKLLDQSVARFDYRHPNGSRSAFTGTLDPLRPLAVEAIHQHMDAYLEALGLAPEIQAFNFFVA